MQRREFVRQSALVTGALAGGMACATTALPTTNSSEAFKIDFAPHAGMFRHSAGEDVLDQIRFAADRGFRSWEDNGMPNRTPELQAKMGELFVERNMRMGVFVCHTIEWSTPSLALGAGEYRDRFLAEIDNSIEVAKRCNAKWMTVVPGFRDFRMEFDLQQANLVETLKQAAAKLESHGLIMVLEPLNFRDHPGMVLTKASQAYLICKAVGSPSCKILFDVYHQQIQEGNLIPNIDASWDEIAYFQIGDNPGRKEPTTGEINYANVLGHVHAKGFSGIYGMEHGNSQEGIKGEEAVIQAYRSVDAK
ncbi:MAG: TIM barrel protein [Bacteroidota bacterium]